jgi:hypothetical protein
MTSSEKKALQRDLKKPVHLFTLIVENNPEGVSNQMQSWGWTYSDSTKEQMVTELMRAWNAGGADRQKALRLVKNVQYRYGVFPAGFDQVITGQPAPPKMLTTDGQGSDQNWYSEMDWGGIIDSIFGGVQGVINDDGATTPPANTPPADGGEEAAKQPFNMQWIAVGGAVLVLIVALVIAMRK